MKSLIGVCCFILLLGGQHTTMADNRIDIGDVDQSQVTIVQGTQADTSEDESESSPWWEHFFKEIITGVLGVIFALMLWRIKKRQDPGHE